MFEEELSSPLVCVLAALALLGPGLAGCVSPSGDTGTGAIYVKDAPEDDWSHVNITFTEIRIHQGSEDGGDGEWITVASNESGREIDLLDFSSQDARALLGTQDLENGTYNQVLINVTEAYGIHKDSGEREDFTLSQPQLRLTRAWQIESGTTTHVIADIDLDRSIQEQGNGEYRFKPVIGQVIVEQGGEASSERGEPQGSGGSDAGQTQQAPMTTYVKDAPEDELSEVWVNFTHVEVHWAGNQTGNETENGTDNETGERGQWITTVNQSRELDLMDFNDTGSKAFLGEADVPVGQYTQIRIEVEEAYAVDNNDTRVNVTVPSGTARVVRSWNVSANQTTAQVTIDLDLERSLVKAGGSGGGQDRGGNQARGNGSAGEQKNRTAEYKLTPVIGKVLMDYPTVDPMTDQRDTEDAAEMDNVDA